MAKTVLKGYYPYLFEKKWPLPFSGSYFICLEILGCNSRQSWSFSDARLDVRSFAVPDRPYSDKYVPAVPDNFVFRGALFDLVFNKKVDKEAVDRALENLGNFLTNKQHLKCLKEVAKKPKCEAEVQSTLALHLFKPLSGDASTTVDEKVYQRSKVPKECLNCKEQVNAGDTSFGCRKVWYGYGDILLERNLVKIDTKRDEESSATQDYSYEVGSGESDILFEQNLETTDTKKDEESSATQDYSYEVGSGESDTLFEQNPVKTDTIRDEESSATQDYSYEIGSGEPKRPRVDRLDSDGADVGLSEDETDFLSVVEVKIASNDSYMPHGPEKINCTDTKQNSILSQVLSQTIVNAFLQAKKFPELQGCFIPSFLASEKYITIHMYNSSLDVLLTQSNAMSLWANDRHDSYDPETILAVWMALNMHKFSRGFPNEGENFETPWYHKSNFHTLTKDELTFYQNSIQRPLEDHVFKTKTAAKVMTQEQLQSFWALIEKYTDE